MGPDVYRVLQYYLRTKLVTVLQWNLPVQSQKEVRTEAMFSALNDCNMRAYVNNFRYAAIVDIDEFIIPKRTNDLLSLLGILEDVARLEVLRNIIMVIIHW